MHTNYKVFIYNSQETIMSTHFLRILSIYAMMNTFLLADTLSAKKPIENPIKQRVKQRIEKPTDQPIEQHVFIKSDEIQAFTFLKNTLNKASDIAKQTNQTQKTKISFAQIMTSALAIPHIAKFSLGREFRRYSPEQFAQFKIILSNYLLKVYATKEKIDIFASINIEDDNINDRAEYSPKKNKLTYEAAFESKNGILKTKFVLIKCSKDQYKIFDIIVEGIGLLSNLRSQISELSGNKSIDAFLQNLSKASELKESF
jgi:ABC-type transporter MlaC component